MTSGDTSDGDANAETYRVAKRLFHLLLRFCSPERREFILGLLPYNGYRRMLRSFPEHVLDGFVRRRVTGVFLAVVTAAAALTAVLSVATPDAVAAAESAALAAYAGSLAYFDTAASRRRRAAALALGAGVLAFASAAAAVLYGGDGAMDTALRSGLGMQAVGLTGVAVVAAARWFRALQFTTIIATFGAVVCGVSDLAAARQAFHAGHPLEAAGLMCVLPLAVLAVVTVPQFDPRPDAI